MQQMSTGDEEKKPQGAVSRVFEEWSRVIGACALVLLSYAQIFKGVVVHDMAWYMAGFLCAGKHALEVIEKVIEKGTRILGKKNDP